jgi:invasion protein IalB
VIGMGIRLAIGVSVVTAVAIGAMAMVFGAPEYLAGRPPAATAPAAPASTPHPKQRLAQATTQTAPSAANTLPSGASALRETYQDWLVACDQKGTVKRCAMVQQQFSKENRQRVLDIELWPTPNRLEGILMLPFGLALDRGVTLQVDDGSPGQALHFRTCLPGGCVVPLSFDGQALASLVHGGMLKINAVVDGGGDAPFAVSLKGFSDAYNRVVALAR